MSLGFMCILYCNTKYFAMLWKISVIFLYSCNCIEILITMKMFFFRLLSMFGGMFVCYCVCMCVCMYVVFILATLFNLQLWNFAIQFFMSCLKTFFFKFWKKKELFTFFLKIVDWNILEKWKEVKSNYFFALTNK